MPISKNGKAWVGPSNSEQYLQNKSAVPQVSALMAQTVSQARRDALSSEVDQGLFRDGSTTASKENGITPNANVVSSVGIKKTAQVVGSGGGFRGGNGESVKQTPEVYSPLWLNSNLNLPRDRATINAWCRSFFALNPFVHNAISLHSTYPISKLNIKCPNKNIEKFFNDMIEELDLMNICVQVAQEYWLLGEAFIYAELNESKGKWDRLLIQNPDYMVVKRTVVANEPMIMLRPDENLKKIIFSNKPADVEQRKQLNQFIIDSVKRGDNIPLENYNISHIARRISPYEIRGTGLPVCVFRQLMLFDKLRECYSEDTEVLTDKGFKKITDLLHFTSDVNTNPNFVNGVALNLDSKTLNQDNVKILSMKEGFKVACMNPETNKLEYHQPVEMHMSYYNGKMVHFKGKKVDCLVSPNHKMWVNPIINNKEEGYKKVPAQQLSNGITYRFQTTSEWVGEELESVNVLGKEISIDVYLKFLGHVISEGCVDNSINKKTNYSRSRVIITQLTQSKYYLDMRSNFEKVGTYLNNKVSTSIKMSGSGFSKHTPKEQWCATITSKELVNYLVNEIGTNNKCDSKNKRIPRWVLNLDKKHLSVILNALLDGDGSRIKLNNNKNRFRYSTASKQLADDVYELVYKLGYAPILQSFNRKTCIEYTVRWSETNKGMNPQVSNYKNAKCAHFESVDYNGVVWCFEVPTGLFVTRRNGKITIQGNSKYAQADNMINPLTLVKIGSADFKPTFADLEAWRNIFEEAQYDKDFKVFTHEGVAVERVGYTGINDISGDITQLIKEIYTGLQVPSVVMDGGGDTTYANGGVALDVLRQRYMQFRNMLAAWLKRKIFAPISKIQGFYEYNGGEKQLIIPDITWNHMSLFDTGDYINTLSTLTQGEGDAKRVSLQTFYYSLGLEYEDEIRKMRKESIQSEISKKEKAALATFDLNSLRSLDEDDEINEVEQAAAAGGAPGGEAPLPGEGPPGVPPDLGGGMPPPPAP
jgi:hypothetical protein